MSIERPVVVAHLSDTHIGMKQAPDAEEKLQRAVSMINERHPDVVVLTGDIGDQYEPSWEKARAILKGLKMPIYYIPGNHDETAGTQERYRKVFGESYYSFDVRFVHFLAIDTQLLGNWEHFDSGMPETVHPEDVPYAERMLDWVRQDSLHLGQRRQQQPDTGKVVVAIQHAAADCNQTGAPDARPYWVLQDPWRTRELEVLRGAGVKHIFSGHWHKGIGYTKDGFHYHVAPATSWSPDAPLGFYMHSISANGDVQTTVVYLRPDATPPGSLRAER